MIDKTISRKKSLVVFVIAVAVCLFAVLPEAIANDKDEARKHFKNGLNLLESEDYTGAAVEFEVSVELFPTKNGLFNLANCYKAQHKYAKALSTLKKLESEFKGKLDSDWKNEIVQMSDDISSLVAELTVEVNLPGAKIKLDGEEQGKSPVKKPVIIGPGEHTIEVSLSGYKTAKRTVRIVSATKSVETFKLEPLVAELTINSNVDGAEIFIDGKKTGMTPLSAPLETKGGKHLLTISMNGYKTLKQNVDLKPGENASFTFTLIKKSEPKLLVTPVAKKDEIKKEEPKVAEPKAEEKKEVARETPVVSDTTVSSIHEDRGGLSGLFWVGLLGSVLTGAATGVFWGVGNGKNSAYEDKYDKFEKDMKDYEYTEQEIDDRLDTLENYQSEAKLFRNLAIGTTIACGTFGLMAVIGLFIRPGEGSSSAVAISPTPHGLRITF